MFSVAPRPHCAPSELISIRRSGLLTFGRAAAESNLTVARSDDDSLLPHLFRRGIRDHLGVA